MSFSIVIPARIGSRRLPAKPLRRLAGRTLIEHVVRAAAATRGARTVLVATDDERIAAEARRCGGEALLTSAGCASGSDRAAEAAAVLPDEVIVDVQADLLGPIPQAVETALAALAADPTAALATVAHLESDALAFADPSVVKVVVDRAGRALYFSRAPLAAGPGDAGGRPFLRHLGCYAYRRPALLAFAALPPSALERAERLEQLRALEHGLAIAVAPIAGEFLSIDTEADLERAERQLTSRRGTDAPWL